MDRIRKTVIDDPKVGVTRHDTYFAVIEKYQQALDNTYYIECISLMESLIADRLESLANQISKSKDYSYKTLEKLLEFLQGKKQKDSLNDEILQCLEYVVTWKNGRNMAIHEMAKLTNNLNEQFSTRYANLKSIAEYGYKLFRELDNSIRQYRK